MGSVEFFMRRHTQNGNGNIRIIENECINEFDERMDDSKIAAIYYWSELKSNSTDR